jgi:hypothetical protein
LDFHAAAAVLAGSLPAGERLIRSTRPCAYWPLKANGIDVLGGKNFTLTDVTFAGGAAVFDGDSSAAERDSSADNFEFGPELAANGGFEAYTGTQDDDTADAFAGWEVVNPGNGRVEATAAAQAGANAAKIIRSSGSTGLRQVAGVTPGSVYCWTFFTHGDGACSGRYSLYDVSNSSYIRSVTSCNVAGTDYARKIYLFTAPANCSQVRMELWQPAEVGSGYAYFDSVSLRKQNRLAIAATLRRLGAGVPGERQYIFCRLTGADNRLWGLRLWGTGEGADADAGKLRWFISKTGDLNSFGVTGGTVLQPDSEYHVYAEYLPAADGAATLRIYVDGVLDAEAADAHCPIFPGASPLTLGKAAVAGSEHYFEGTLRDAVAWQDTLPGAAQILALAQV